jgi:hypothetical protein
MINKCNDLDFFFKETNLSRVHIKRYSYLDIETDCTLIRNTCFLTHNMWIILKIRLVL